MRSDPTSRFASELPVEGLGAEGRNLEDGVSFSGHERNHLFLNRAGRDFVDASGVSALDDPADARAFAWLDFDRDGWLDLAVVNANRPLLQIFHNELSGAIDAPRDVLAFRFAGAHREATPARGKRFECFLRFQILSAQIPNCFIRCSTL